MRVALVITTYERPDALAAVLASITRQRVAPDEIVIADDGSGAETRAVAEQFTRSSTVQTKLVTQSHEGFRVARLRNLAIAATQLEYLVFVDGDMVLHPEFIADHIRVARRGCFTQGVRVLADAALTRQLLSNPSLRVTWRTRGLGVRRRVYLLHSAACAAAARKIANSFTAIKSCNLAVWRDDLVRVNGFNEAFEGWGPEDKELAARLTNVGVHRQTLLFGGIACHLHHPPASRAALPANLALLKAAKDARHCRCERGLDAHLR